MFDSNSNITLVGTKVKLIPLSKTHAYSLAEMIHHYPSLLQFSPSVINSFETSLEYIKVAISHRSSGLAYPFAVIEMSTDKMLGTTRFGNISPIHKRLEIGWTFLTPEVHGHGINTEIKYLMLSYAFESLQFKRVEFKTDSRNMQSRKAILKLGAKEEGTLRSHTLLEDGYRRDTVYYSILQEEWPHLKRQLESSLSV